jgi:Sap, sulfolipid-1-addressing protein
VGEVLLLAFLAAANSLMLGAVTVMLSLRRPKRMLLGYLLGAYAVSITIGLALVFWGQGRHAAQSVQRDLSPVVGLVVGAVALLTAGVLALGLDRKARRPRDGRARTRKERGPPRWQRELDKGDARLSFAVGMLLTLPGARYLAALNALAKLGYGPAATVVLVVVVNLILLLLVEVPLVSYLLAEDWTPGAVERFNGWLGENRRAITTTVTVVVGAALVIRSLVALA